MDRGDIDINCNVKSDRDEAIECRISGWRVQIYREDDAPDCPFMAALYDPASATPTVAKYLTPEERCDTDAEQVGSLITQAADYIRDVERAPQRAERVREMEKERRRLEFESMLKRSEQRIRDNEQDERMGYLTIDHTGGGCMAYAIHGDNWWCWLTEAEGGIDFLTYDRVLLGLYTDTDSGDYAAMKSWPTVKEALDFMFGDEFDKWVGANT